MARGFTPLRVADVEKLTDEAVAVSFENPAEGFAFAPGQYLTLRARVDGAEVRRSYSLCSPSGRLRVGVKRVADGRFSTFAHELKPGDEVEAMAPEGRFTIAIGRGREYLMISAGSGITPMMAIARAVLEGEPESRITLVYGNRDAGSIMFREELEDLKNRHMGRFQLIHVLSRERQDFDLGNGRIDGDKLAALSRAGLIDPAAADAALLCGPGDMIEAAQAALVDLGADPAAIRFERFTPAADAAPRPPSRQARAAAETGARVETILDGARRGFAHKDPSLSVLAAAHAEGIELPYSCAGGMCCTCRAKVLEGAAEMAVNYSLQPWEIEAGFTLACQARPTSERLVLDFDAA